MYQTRPYIVAALALVAAACAQPMQQVDVNPSLEAGASPASTGFRVGQCSEDDIYASPTTIPIDRIAGEFELTAVTPPPREKAVGKLTLSPETNRSARTESSDPRYFQSLADPTATGTTDIDLVKVGATNVVWSPGSSERGRPGAAIDGYTMFLGGYHMTEGGVRFDITRSDSTGFFGTWREVGSSARAQGFFCARRLMAATTGASGQD